MCRPFWEPECILGIIRVQVFCPDVSGGINVELTLFGLALNS